MKTLGKIAVGIIAFMLAEFLSINVGTMIGSGAYEIGLIVTSLSILTAVVIVCTMIIVDTIKENGSK
ncbi:MAG: hypothetical protein N4A40_05955 [Tissierellales bacterium]|jgi:uncharacterized membrane protein|nr:hypothetical protein [Tissierellales bacterium]